jgi:HEAT repeat protein
MDDFTPPPNRTWLWVVLGVAAILIVGAGGAYVYIQGEEQREIEELLARSSSLPPAERAAALRRVLTSDVHDSFRKDAAYQLGALADGEAVALLVEVIDDPEELSQTAAVALGRMAQIGRLGEGDQARARERIFPQLEQAQGMGRTQFAFALALLNDARCLEPLLQGYIDNEQARSLKGLDAHLVARFANAPQMIELTKSPDPAVRMFAAQALGAKRAAEGADALSQLLTDANHAVVQAAAEALAKVAPDRAGSELIRLMHTKSDMQGSLIQALRDSVGAPGVQPIYDNTDDWDFKLKLIQHVRSPPPPGREQPPDVPRGIGDPRGGDMCADFYQNYPGPHRVQKEMGLWCLEELGDARAAEGLFQIAEEPFSTERDTIIDDSIKSIGALRLPGSAELLLKLLEKGKGRPATILNALGRVGDASLGRKIERYTHCPEADVLSGGACDRETALRVLGKIRWDGALKLLTETAERRSDDKVATRIESRDIWQEFRLRDRVGALEGLAHLGNPEAAELLMTTMEDTQDDPQIRLEAARALAYSANDEVVAQILAKIRDSNLNVDTRKYYVATLWHNPNADAVGTLMELVADSSTPSPMMLAAGFGIGEAGPSLVDQERLRTLLGAESTEPLVAASVAALMSGDEETIHRLLMLFRDRQGLESQVRDRYAGPEGHAVYLTPALFESGRIYRRLYIAHLLREADQSRHGWAWQHLTQRLLLGTTNWPNGMSPYEIRQQLAEDVRSAEQPEWKQMAALALLRMGFRGMVLMLAAEEGPGAEVARQVLVGAI